MIKDAQNVVDMGGESSENAEQKDDADNAWEIEYRNDPNEVMDGILLEGKNCYCI